MDDDDDIGAAGGAGNYGKEIVIAEDTPVIDTNTILKEETVRKEILTS